MNIELMVHDAVAQVRGMVKPLTAIRLSRSCSHFPELFFSEIFRELDEPMRAVARRLGRQVNERLRVPWNPDEWDKLVWRRLARAKQFVKVIMTDAFVFGFKGFEQSEVPAYVLRWLMMDWSGVAVKQVKAQLTWLSGYGRGVEAPTTGLLDKPGFLLSPKLLYWTKAAMRLKTHVTKNCPYSVSQIISETLLLGSKRGFPSIEDDQVNVAARAYTKQMSEAVPLQGPHSALVRAALVRTTREVFGAGREEVHVGPFVPSRNAGYLAPRAVGGILGAIQRKLSVIGDVELISALESSPGHILWIHGRRVDYQLVWSTLIREWSASRVLAVCQIYMIREPLKLRTITAGSPDLYGGLVPMLRQLRRGMQKFDCFRLTRAENDAAWLSERLNRTPLWLDRYSTVWDMFVSGDYQQSTNDLSMEATTICRETAWGGPLGVIGEKALGSQTLEWKDIALDELGNPCEEDDARVDEAERIQVEQRRGQLMGSPLSFPFLCVINAALARLAYDLAYPELSGRTKSLDSYPFAVNGDDFVARMDNRVYKVWCELLDCVSWKLSPGKSYYLGALAQVNSQTMEVLRVPGEYRPRYVLTNPIPFVNGGYLHQMTKATEQIDRPPLESMSLDWQKRYSSYTRLPHGMCSRAQEQMLLNLDAISWRMYRRGVTPFPLAPQNPVELGGFGLVGTRPLDFRAACAFELCEPELDDTIHRRCTSYACIGRKCKSTDHALLHTQDFSVKATRSQPLLVEKLDCPMGARAVYKSESTYKTLRRGLLDRQLDELDRYVHREGRYQTPGDVVDPTDRA